MCVLGVGNCLVLFVSGIIVIIVGWFFVMCVV